MKRWIALIVAVLLPLQMAWGVAAAYCQHESGIQGERHFGHHAHVHQTHGAAQADPHQNQNQNQNQNQHDQSSSAKLQLDADCAFCHAPPAASPAAMATEVPGLNRSPSPPTADGNRLASAPQPVPDRPQWLGLA